MKKKTSIWAYSLAIMGIFLMFTSGCVRDNKDDETPKTGVLKFQTLNSFKSPQRGTVYVKSTQENPPLTGDTTETLLTSMRTGLGDIWVSQGEVKAGKPDNLEWIRLTSVTNKELKLFEEYQIDPKELPVGVYKSIKISLRNIWYRHTELVSDPSVKYELLETMVSYFDPCDENDTSWVEPNYFSIDGNHRLNVDGVFELVGPDEKVGLFTIEAGKTAIVSWRYGAGATKACTSYLIDVNGNREWDCGTDYIITECPPDYKYFDFIIEYE